MTVLSSNIRRYGASLRGRPTLYDEFMRDVATAVSRRGQGRNLRRQDETTGR